MGEEDLAGAILSANDAPAVREITATRKVDAGKETLDILGDARDLLGEVHDQADASQVASYAALVAGVGRLSALDAEYPAQPDLQHNAGHAWAHHVYG